MTSAAREDQARGDAMSAAARADPESELDRILELQRDARHLVAADALEELEARLDGSAAAARCRARLSPSPAVVEPRPKFLVTLVAAA